MWVNTRIALSLLVWVVLVLAALAIQAVECDAKVTLYGP